MGENPCCYWSNSGTIVRITLGSSATLRVGDEITINPALLRTSSGSGEIAEGSNKIDLSPSGQAGVPPQPRIRAASIYRVGCGDLQIDASQSVGGHYQNMTYSWTLTLTGSTDSTTFDALVAQFNAPKQEHIVINIPQADLSELGG